MDLSGIFNDILKAAEQDLINGVEKGVGYIRDVTEMTIWSAEQIGKPDFAQNQVFCFAQCAQITKQWMIELYGAERTATSTLLPNVIAYFEGTLTGSGNNVDPFLKSREMAQGLDVKAQKMRWGKYADPAK
jgi:hypothetical protein